MEPTDPIRSVPAQMPARPPALALGDEGNFALALVWTLMVLILIVAFPLLQRFLPQRRLQSSTYPRQGSKPSTHQGRPLDAVADGADTPRGEDDKGASHPRGRRRGGASDHSA